MGDLALGVFDRRDRGHLPEQLAILAHVVKFAAPLAAGGDRLPQVRVFVRRRLARFQKARVLPAHFIQRVSGYRCELGIRVFDVAVQIGDDDRAGTLLDSARQLAKLVFGLAAARRRVDHQRAQPAKQHDIDDQVIGECPAGDGIAEQRRAHERIQQRDAHAQHATQQ